MTLPESERGILHALCSSTLVVEEVDPRSMPADLGALFPVEAARMAKAVDKRRREFTAGRVLARRAMARLGHPEVAIAHGDDRAPVWPAGITGSITHTDRWCGVALATHEARRGLGIDVEVDSPLKPDVLDAIVSDDDRAWLRSHSVQEQCALGKLVFSAKESAYKAQYAITQEFLGFDAMWVAIDFDAERFVATFRREAGVFAVGDRLEGRFARVDGLVATVVEIE